MKDALVVAIFAALALPLSSTGQETLQVRDNDGRPVTWISNVQIRWSDKGTPLEFSATLQMNEAWKKSAGLFLVIDVGDYGPGMTSDLPKTKLCGVYEVSVPRLLHDEIKAALSARFDAELCVPTGVMIREVVTNDEAQHKKREDAIAERTRLEDIARIRTNCAAVYKTTLNMKVSDLTVKQTKQMETCEAMGMYHP